MSYPSALRHAHTERFPEEGSTTNVHVETKWADDERKDAQLVLETRSERLEFHVYSNHSGMFREIIDTLGHHSKYKLYDARIEVDPPKSVKGVWDRTAAAAVLAASPVSPIKFSFSSGTVNGYGTINATFYAYRLGAERNTGSIVRISLVVMTDVSFQIPKTSIPGRRP